MLHHVALPRIGALKVILDTLNSTASDNSIRGQKNAKPLKYVIDVTIGYENGVPLDVFSITSASRPPCETHLHYRVYPISAIPRGDDAATLQWLFDRFVEKEQLLETFYATGHFPAVADVRGAVAQQRQRSQSSSVQTTASNNLRSDDVAGTSPGKRKSATVQLASAILRKVTPTTKAPASNAQTKDVRPVDEPVVQMGERQTHRAQSGISHTASSRLQPEDDGMTTERRFVTDNVYIACLHIFFIVSFYVQCSFISDLISCVF